MPDLFYLFSIGASAWFCLYAFTLWWHPQVSLSLIWCPKSPWLHLDWLEIKPFCLAFSKTSTPYFIPTCQTLKMAVSQSHVFPCHPLAMMRNCNKSAWKVKGFTFDQIFNKESRCLADQLIYATQCLRGDTSRKLITNWNFNDPS